MPDPAPTNANPNPEAPANNDAPANTPPANEPPANNPPKAGDKPGDKPADGAKPESKPDVDLTKLTPEQLQKVLENPELFKQPRIKELLEAQKELKKFQTEQQQREEASLVEQKKFEELAEKRLKENEALQGRLKETSINQALSNKLAGQKTVDLDGALRLIDRSKLSLDDNGSVSGVDEAIEALKTDKPYLFEKAEDKPTTQPTVGAPSNTQNGNNEGAKTAFKRSEIAAMDSKTYAENRTAILKAQMEGRVEDDISGNKKQ